MDYRQAGITLPQEMRATYGGPQSGKTAALASHAHNLVDAGIAPQDILFVVAAPACEKQARALLPEGVQVRTARSVASDILGCTNGRNRLLQPYEEQLLFEDLRTTGLPHKPLRRVLAFIYATMASLGDWNPAWIEMHEERLVYTTLMDTLAFTGGVVEPELANLACKMLVSDGGIRSQFAVPYVLADDFDLANGASQALCALLATRGLHVAGQKSMRPAVFDSHPAGLESFAAQAVEGAAAAVATFSTDELAGAAQGEAPCEEHHGAHTVQEEIAYVVDRVQEAIAGSGPTMRVAVVGANTVWQRNAVRALEQAGIAVDRPPHVLRIRDFADETLCNAVCTDAFAKLDINPHDGVALRTLLGCGDHLAHSAEIKRLRTTNPGKTLANLVADGTVSLPTAPVGTSAQSTRPHNGTPIPCAGVSAAQGDTSAACGSANKKTAAPPEQPDTPQVFACAATDLFGQHFDMVIFGGCVKGWIPDRSYFDAVGTRKDTLLQQAIQHIDCVRQAATGNVLFTHFEECSLEFAERLGLHYSRIVLKDGVRTCLLEPFDTNETP